MRRRAKIDANQSQIVKELRQMGMSVQSLATIGNGCGDILVGTQGSNYVFEIKQGKGKLTPDEDLWHVGWRGQVAVIHSTEEALEVICGGRND